MSRHRSELGENGAAFGTKLAAVVDAGLGSAVGKTGYKLVERTLVSLAVFLAEIFAQSGITFRGSTSLPLAIASSARSGWAAWTFCAFTRSLLWALNIPI